MPTVIGIKFRNTAKVYYFDPLTEVFAEGDGAIVETARGVEFGKVVMANKEVGEKEVVQPLKPIVRKATAEDFALCDKLESLREKTAAQAEEHIKKLNPEMKLVDVEHTFDQSKIVFYFTAEGRVDFRELVKSLASTFRKRIEMRQIDDREDIKLRGGLSPCGRPCCCTQFSADGDKVSIKMAKNQGLPLNPTKISGLCGKLMCCLRFENEYYAEVNKVMPKVGAHVNTPDGEGVVVSTDALRVKVKVKFEKADGVTYTDYEPAEVKKIDVPQNANQQNNQKKKGDKTEKNGKNSKKANANEDEYDYEELLDDEDEE